MPPDATTADPWAPAVERALAAHKTRPGALLPILHEIQHALGHVPPAAVPVIADALNLSRAEVHGVVTFYHEFREHAPGKHVVKICLAEACQSLGCEDLLAHARAKLGVELHGTTSDGAITLEPVYCLGNCACSPAIRIDDDVHGLVDAGKLAALLDELRTQAIEVR